MKGEEMDHSGESKHLGEEEITVRLHKENPESD